MHTGTKLICIVCVHTECALTAIRIECAFSQSTSIGGLKSVWRWIGSWRKIFQVLYFACDRLCEETSDEARNNKCYFVALLR